jgi:hypothetical protein
MTNTEKARTVFDGHVRLKSKPAIREQTELCVGGTHMPLLGCAARSSSAAAERGAGGAGLDGAAAGRGTIVKAVRFNIAGQRPYGRVPICTAGLAPTPWLSGRIQREQGNSKSGNLSPQRSLGSFLGQQPRIALDPAAGALADARLGGGNALPPWPGECQPQHHAGLDREVRIVDRPAGLRRMPRRDRLWRHLHRQATAVAQRSVVLPPALRPVSRLRDPVAAAFVIFVRHRRIIIPGPGGVFSILFQRATHPARRRIVYQSLAWTL